MPPISRSSMWGSPTSTASQVAEQLSVLERSSPRDPRLESRRRGLRRARGRQSRVRLHPEAELSAQAIESLLATAADRPAGCRACAHPRDSSRRRRPLTRSDDEAPLRVVLAEDSLLLREGIARLLTDSGIEIVGQSGTAEDLLRKVRSYSARHRDRRHQDAADADRRGPARGQGDPRGAPGHRGARALPVHRGGLRARAAAGERRGSRLPAEGPGVRPGRLRRRRPPRRRGGTALDPPSSPSSSDGDAATIRSTS